MCIIWLALTAGDLDSFYPPRMLVLMPHKSKLFLFQVNKNWQCFFCKDIAKHLNGTAVTTKTTTIFLSFFVIL